MYYLFGNEEFLIEKKIEQIINENSTSVVLKFNSDATITEVVNQISTFSLFDQNRVLIFNNLPFLTGKTKENEDEIIVKSLGLKPETTKVIFVTSKLNDKFGNNLYKFLKNNAKCIEFNQLTDNQIISVVQEKISIMGASISEIDLHYFLSKIPNKLSIIMTELEKLIFLDKNISRTNIDDLIQKYDLGNAFDFINAFHNSDANEIFKTYYNKLIQGETIQNFISQITNVLELCSRIYSLKKTGYSLKDIETKLEKHPVVIKKNAEFLDVVGYEKISKYLELISKIDTDIKKHKKDEKVEFERFLLEVVK